MGNAGSSSGPGGERSHVTRDIRSDGVERELRPEGELVDSDNERIEEPNRKSHESRRTPEPSTSYITQIRYDTILC